MERQSREVLLGVTGCIGAYKAAEIIRLLRRAGMGVQVILTEHARWFITEGTLQTLSGRQVLTDPFQPRSAASIEHIDLARQSDLMLVAPATANSIGKFAGGIADDLLSTTYLAHPGPVLVAPAMNTGMYRHAAVQRNLEILAARGVEIIGPGEGELACGEIGAGRLLEPEAIVQAVERRLRGALPQRSLAGRRVVITSGPTREPIDPVRFVSNASTGRMGHALARAARDRGASVTLIHGPTALSPPAGVQVVRVETVREMREAVMAHVPGVDLVVMAAAVGDHEVAAPAARKLKKSGGHLTLDLAPAPDILAELGRRKGGDSMPVLVGFAAETEDLVVHARAKLKAKNLDYVVANPVGEAGSGFGAETNRITLLPRGGEAESWPLLSKEEVADRLMDRIAAEHFALVSPGVPSPRLAGTD